MLAVRQALTAEQRLEKCVVDIIGHKRYIAMAGVLLLGKRVVVDKPMPFTACTNGRDELYGREFIETLSDAELRGVILHENKHKVYRHLTTWRWLFDKDARCANMSCDYVINIEVKDENPDGFATLPQGALLDNRFRNMHAKNVFDILYEEQQGGGQGGAGDGQSLDEHDWEGAQEMSEAEKRDLERDIDQAIRQGALTAGKVGADAPRGFEQLLQPQVNWRDVLREFVSATCCGKDYSTWNRPNRRYVSAGVYMPSSLGETMGELVLAVDTSGSIGDADLTMFLSEVKAICDTVRPDSIRLLYWGTNVVADEQYGGVNGKPLEQLVQSTKPRGGGGTDVNCVCNYMRDNNIKAEAVVVLTDGYLAGDWGTWAHPLLWCILDNTNAKPTVGKYTYINK